MNISKIAKKANVSIATISRALNPAERQKVATETLHRIDSLVSKYGYAPSLGAKSMRCARFRTLGVVLPHFLGIFDTDYYVQVLNGVADALLESEYRFKLIMLRSDGFQWDQQNNLIIEKSGDFKSRWDNYHFKTAEGVDGLVVVHWPLFFSKSAVLEKLSIPCLVINDPEPNIRVNFSMGDNLMGGKLAAQYLYSKGHRNVAILTGLPSSRDSSLRLKGFKNFFDKVGAPVDITVLRGDFHERNAALAVESFYKKGGRKKVTAFFCCNDLMAFGVIKKLKEMGLICPTDVSVIGYDDDKRSESFSPPLTTIHVPIHELVREGVARLVLHLKEGGKTPFHGQTLFPVRLIERESVAVVN